MSEQISELQQIVMNLQKRLAKLENHCHIVVVDMGELKQTNVVTSNPLILADKQRDSK